MNARDLGAKAAPLCFDLQWNVAAGRFAAKSACLPGLTMVTGAGAPSLLRLLAGCHVPHSGVATLDGRPLRHGREVRRHGPATRPVACVLPDLVVRHWGTALGSVHKAARAQGVPYLGARRRATTALEWAGAGEVAHRLIFRLNRSDRQRVLLARALVQVPGLLLLDSALDGLSRTQQLEVWRVICRLAAAWEAVVLTTDIPDHGLAAHAICVESTMLGAAPR